MVPKTDQEAYERLTPVQRELYRIQREKLSIADAWTVMQREYGVR